MVISVTRTPTRAGRQPVSRPEKAETIPDDKPELRVRRRPLAEPKVKHRPAKVCLVEIDLSSLRLPKRRKLRAWILATLAAEYGPQLRSNPYLQRFEVIIIADTGRHCGLWVWLTPTRARILPGHVVDGSGHISEAGGCDHTPPDRDTDGRGCAGVA
jgi:hypothetical protein